MKILAACILAFAVSCDSAAMPFTPYLNKAMPFTPYLNKGMPFTPYDNNGMPFTPYYKSNDPFHPVDGAIERLINQTINNMLANLTDPIPVADVSEVMASSSISGTLNVSGISIAGIKYLVASQIDVVLTSLSLNMTIDIPDLTANIEKYAMNLLAVELVPLYGSGAINVDLKGIKLHITGKVSIAQNFGESIYDKELVGLSVSNITLVLTADSGTFLFTGLLYNDDFSNLISTALSDVFVDFIDNNSALISSIISPIAEKIINGLFSGGHNFGQNELEELKTR